MKQMTYNLNFCLLKISFDSKCTSRIESSNTKRFIPPLAQIKHPPRDQRQISLPSTEKLPFAIWRNANLHIKFEIKKPPLAIRSNNAPLALQHTLEDHSLCHCYTTSSPELRQFPIGGTHIIFSMLQPSYVTSWPQKRLPTAGQLCRRH